MVRVPCRLFPARRPLHRNERVLDCYLGLHAIYYTYSVSIVLFAVDLAPTTSLYPSENLGRSPIAISPVTDPVVID